eukprot:6200942-Pleurochrysis_carterae.AAC.2
MLCKRSGNLLKDCTAQHAAPDPCSRPVECPLPAAATFSPSPLTVLAARSTCAGSTQHTGACKI